MSDQASSPESPQLLPEVNRVRNVFFSFSYDRDAHVYEQARAFARRWRRNHRQHGGPSWRQESLFEDLDDPYMGLWVDILRLTNDQASVGRDLVRAIAKLLVLEYPSLLLEIANDISKAVEAGKPVDQDTRVAVARALRELADHLESQGHDALMQNGALRPEGRASREAG